MAAGIKKICDVYDSDWYREEVVKAKRGNRAHIAKHDRSFSAIMKAMADDDASTDPIQPPAATHHASTIADLLVEAKSFPHRAAALQHLLHKPSGQALL
jgi:hypothetical protein